MSQHYPELFRRHSGNPILTAADWPYPVNSVFNPGATLLPDGTTLLLCRVEDRRGLSHLCAARSVNGVDDWKIDRAPTLMPGPGATTPRSCGASRIRASPMCPSWRQYAVVYTAYSQSGPGVSLALTKDFHDFERFGMIMLARGQGRGAAAAPDRRLLGADPPPGLAARRAHVDVVLARPAPLGQPQG